MEGLKDAGYEIPTPIQESVIPPVMEGRDILACAQTGSGKTAAFLLPIFHRLASRPPLPGAGPRALILTPTRELAVQILEHCDMLGYHSHIRSVAVYGGVGMDAQERSLKGGVEVVVATPGRLMDHMRHPYTTFERVEVLVLDEADRMLDMGFIPDVKRILRALPPKERRQTLFLSATIPPPVAVLSQEMLKDPVRVDIERPPLAAEGISHSVFPVGEDRKADLFLALYRRRRFETVLAFTRTKDRAERLSRFLKRNGVPCASIHGDRTQEDRTKALLDFRTGKLPVLVATDIAARGLDIEDIGHVVNIDLPQDLDDYIHRVGRTARAGAEGDAFTFVTPKEERKLASIEKRLKVIFKREVLEEFAGKPSDEPSREHKRSHKRPRHKPRKPV